MTNHPCDCVRISGPEGALAIQVQQLASKISETMKEGRQFIFQDHYSDEAIDEVLQRMADESWFARRSWGVGGRFRVLEWSSTPFVTAAVDRRPVRKSWFIRLLSGA